jgi:hypothetical protein
LLQGWVARNQLAWRVSPVSASDVAGLRKKLDHLTPEVIDKGVETNEFDSTALSSPGE